MSVVIEYRIDCETNVGDKCWTVYSKLFLRFLIFLLCCYSMRWHSGKTTFDSFVNEKELYRNK